MIHRRISNRYIKALLDVAAEQGRIEEVERELQDIDRLLRDNADLMNLLLHPKISRLRKKKVIDDIFGNRVSPAVKNFLDFLIEKKREQILTVVLEEYTMQADKLRGMVKAQVRSAFDLPERQMKTLKAALEKKLDRRVEFQLEVDKTILGGLQVFIGNDVLDGSIQGRLASLQKYLLEATLS